MFLRSGISLAVASTYGKPIQWTDRGRQRWAIDFGVVEGRRRRVYGSVDPWGARTPFASEAERDVELARIRARLREHGDLREALAPYFGDFQTVLSLGAAWDRYLEHQAFQADAGKITAEHLRQLRKHGRNDLGPLRSVPAAGISYAILEDWLLWLGRERKLGAASRRHALAVVSGCLRWMERRGEIERVPPLPRVEIPEHAPAILSDETQRLVLAAIPEERRGIFLAMSLMALRMGEARRVDAHLYRDGVIRFEETKKRRVKSLPCPPEVEQWIEANVPLSERLRGRPLFANPEAPDLRWKVTPMRMAWRRAQLEALGRVVAPLQEGTRHSRATHWMREGHSLAAIQAVLDHRHPQTTQRYARLSGQAVIDVLRPRRSGSGGAEEKHAHSGTHHGGTGTADR